ncbi:MAG: hypothetical protein Ct9H90mP16_04920 [Candidatus Poseidoniales archaeon]|nr:MAG: hypothetical protein Ct9H90mP16_04920 [Candidatus Poseidoniales archaeon]
MVQRKGCHIQLREQSVQPLPPMHDVAKMAGVELPEYLGSMSEDSE